MGKWRETFRENCETAELVYRLQRDPTSATHHDVLVLLREATKKRQVAHLPPHKKKCERCGDTFYTFGGQWHRKQCTADKCLPELRTR